jgi:hypothetical protein
MIVASTLLLYNNNNIKKPPHRLRYRYRAKIKLEIMAKARLDNIRRWRRHKFAPARRYLPTTKRVTLLKFKKVDVEDIWRRHILNQISELWA